MAPRAYNLVKTFYSLLGGLLICSNVFAEDTSCFREIPVNVILPDAAIVRKLRPEQFTASIKNERTPIASVIPDNGPRRIVFVVETAKSNSEAVRRIELAIVAEIVESARPQDSFALITAHGPRREVRFGEAREKLGSVIQELGEAAKGKKEFSGVLDSVQEATGWLQPHQPGDAIVVISSGIEKPPGISYEKVRDELTSARIRLFGFQLSTFISGYVSMGLAGLPAGSGMIPRAYIASNDQSLHALSGETGGFALVEDTTPQTATYKLTDQHLEPIKKRSAQFYKTICEYYAVRFKGPAQGGAIDLSDDVRAKLSPAMLVYPRRGIACSAPDAPLNDLIDRNLTGFLQ